MHPIERILGYTFHTHGLLLSAITHPSAGKNHYQRLEFLGDRILGLMAAEWLMTQNHSQGVMAQQLSDLTSKHHLARVGAQLELLPHIRTSLPADQKKKATFSLLSDVLEALMGAVFLDADYATTRRIFLPKLIDEGVRRAGERHAKNLLQEWTQKHTQTLPHYQVIQSEGQSFTVECSVPPYPPTYGTATQKRSAELIAAQHMLTQIGISS